MKRPKIGKTAKRPNFAENQLFATSLIFVEEKFLKHYYKLDQILRNFISDVSQNFQPISRKSSLKVPGGRFPNNSTVCQGNLEELTNYRKPIKSLVNSISI